MSAMLKILGFNMFLVEMKFIISVLLPLDKISSIVSRFYLVISLFTMNFYGLATATTVPSLATLAG